VKKIGLCMIVKNEAHTIETCLRSVHRLVDYVLIEDTGSTDGTQSIIRSYLADHAMQGEVFQADWQDFATNRSIGLDRLRQNQDIDYALVIDADDVLEMAADFEPAAFKATLHHDYYDMDIRLGSILYARPQILSNRRPFAYRGVLHEFVDALSEFTHARAAGLSIKCGTHGGRSKNPQKYLDDAALLERTLDTETDAFLRSRYTYYLAQSLRDAGQPDKALARFLERSAMGFWSEEVYVSLLSAGRMMQRTGHDLDDTLAIYDRASAINPARVEALHDAARLCNQNGRSAQAYAFARRGMGRPKPVGGLFVEAPIYDYRLPDEFAIAAYWTGAYAESLAASTALLGGDTLPAQERTRVSANAKFALAKLPQPASFGQQSFVDQFIPQTPRDLCARLDDPPRVMVAILAKQAAVALPLYLECIEALDYPKTAITLYIRTNNNTDDTAQILHDWVDRVRPMYDHIEFDPTNLPVPVEQFDVHEWNPLRFAVLSHLRNSCLQKTLEYRCDFLLMADTDNFIRPHTLRNLVASNLPIVAPLLRSADRGSYYSNFFAQTTETGYYAECEQYHWVLERRVCGLIELPLVHCTYLVRADVIPHLGYSDGSDRYEFVIFSDRARQAGVPQYIDNREVYGYIGRDDIVTHVRDVNALMRAELDTAKAGPYRDRLQADAVPHAVGDGM
jgi:hypothetical protein